MALYKIPRKDYQKRTNKLHTVSTLNLKINKKKPSNKYASI